jgi:hypothetical protein
MELEAAKLMSSKKKIHCTFSITTALGHGSISSCLFEPFQAQRALLST